MSLIRKVIEWHRFFMRESRQYVLGGRNVNLSERISYLRGFPRAYVTFMYLSLRDWMRIGAA